jgi:hypothetical protein
LEQHCYDCHDAETKKGDLDLTALTLDTQHVDLLIKVHDAVERGEMPPKKKKQPAEAEKAAFVKELEAKLMAMTAPAPGGVSKHAAGPAGVAEARCGRPFAGGWPSGRL